MSGLFADRSRMADLLLLSAFVAVVTAPFPSVARLVTYLLALLAIATPALWRGVAGSRTAWCAAGLLLYLLLTTLWSQNPETHQAFRVLVRALVLGGFVLAFADSVRRGVVNDRIGRWFALAGGLVCLAAIGSFLLDSPPAGRLRGFGRALNSLSAAQAYTVVALFALHWASQATTFRARAVAVASALAASLAVVLTGSRSAWVALPAACIVQYLAARGWSNSRFAGTALAAVTGLGLAVVALAINDSTRGFVLPRGDSYRLDIWAAVVADVTAHGIWFGRGILSADDVSSAELSFRHAHNMYLSVFRQGGLVGCAILAATIAGTVGGLMRRLEHPDARLAIALLVAGLLFWLLGGRTLIASVGVQWWLFWLPVATAIGLRSRPGPGDAES